MEVLRSLTTVFCPAPDYFSAYLGEYRNVLSALETLNAAVLAAMDKTKLVRTAPGEGCRAPGWEIGAVLSSAAGGVKFGAGRQQTHQIKGVPVHVQAVLQPHSREGGEPSPGRGRANPKLLCSGDIISPWQGSGSGCSSSSLQGPAHGHFGSITESPC